MSDYSGGPDPSMTQKEEDEFFLIYGSRKMKKEIRARQAAEQAKKLAQAQTKPD